MEGKAQSIPKENQQQHLPEVRALQERTEAKLEELAAEQRQQRAALEKIAEEQQSQLVNRVIGE